MGFRALLSDGTSCVVAAFSEADARAVIEASLRDEQADGQFDRGLEIVRVEASDDPGRKRV